MRCAGNSAPCVQTTPETEKNYGAGSYVFIPANLPHSNSQPEGALLYGEQPGKFDNKPVK
jgi:hypothetical protein